MMISHLISFCIHGDKYHRNHRFINIYNELEPRGHRLFIHINNRRSFFKREFSTGRFFKKKSFLASRIKTHALNK